MIDRAKQKYQNEKRLSFLQLNIETFLPNEEVEQYNNVLSFYCLHWCQDIRYCLTFTLLRNYSITQLNILHYPI